MRSPIRLLLVAAAALSLALPAATAAADHLDGAAVKENGATDINDVYVFQGGDADNTVLSFDVNPAAGVMSGTSFDPGVEYAINVDTDADLVEDIVYSITFAADEGGTQAYTVTKDGAEYATGVTGTNAEIGSGGQVFAGLVDDPFFFDLDGFNAFKASILDADAEVDANLICDADADVNFFAGFNASAIVLEVPDAELAESIGVWAVTRDGVGGSQIDRMGKPGINTIFLHEDATKDAFNVAAPAGDLDEYTDDVSGTTSAILQKAFEYTEEDANTVGDGIAAALLPDALVYDTTTGADFAMFNGRALADDVIDVAYGAILDGNVSSDCVANDSTFRADFPYWGAANAAMPDTASQPDPTSTSASSITLIAVASLLLLVGGASVVLVEGARRRR